MYQRKISIQTRNVTFFVVFYRDVEIHYGSVDIVNHKPS